ncbi:Receptor-like protein 2 [Morella rubra]|uniref:Receptor-like protein 2 n=1 Tax=Morella rubra TaxID=262757 RepID=A0A6A1WQD1_9ROSI|nr:Receptor-like protein 2 [Morella rubra]
MARNNFTGKLPASLYSCKSLRAIRFAGNQIEGEIQPEMVQLESLSFLSLAYNKLTNITGAINILMRCKTLSIVLMTKNFLHEAMPSDDSIVVSNGFEYLRCLSLGSGKLTGQLPLWLSKLKKLEVLDLSDNCFSGSIPGWLSTFPKLFRLVLSDNLFSGEFPKELWTLPALQSPQPLVDNTPLELTIYISGPGDTFEFNRLSSLGVTLAVGNNRLNGNIPFEIGRLKQLRELNISHNNFSGNISDQLSELTNLEVLDLSSNRLYGEIPASLAKLHFLKKFSVANNKLQGAIPLGTQLQSFDASAYVGNLALCGPPLPNECADITRKERDKEVLHEENGIAIPWHHISVVLGFITGFWGICGPIAFNRTGDLHIFDSWTL